MIRLLYDHSQGGAHLNIVRTCVHYICRRIFDLLRNIFTLRLYFPLGATETNLLSFSVLCFWSILTFCLQIDELRLYFWEQNAPRVTNL